MVESKVFSYSSDIMLVERNGVRIALCKNDNWVYIVNFAHKVAGNYVIPLACECMRKSEATIKWKSTLTHLLIGELDVFSKYDKDFACGDAQLLGEEKMLHVRQLADRTIHELNDVFIDGYCAVSAEFAGTLFTLRRDGLYECRTRDRLNLSALPEDSDYVLLSRIAVDGEPAFWLLCLDAINVDAIMGIQRATKAPVYRRGL